VRFGSPREETSDGPTQVELRRSVGGEGNGIIAQMGLVRFVSPKREEHILHSGNIIGTSSSAVGGAIGTFGFLRALLAAAGVIMILLLRSSEKKYVCS